MLFRSTLPNCRIRLYSFSLVTTMLEDPMINNASTNRIRDIFFTFFIFIKLPFCRQWLLCSFRGAALRRSGSGTCEGFQRIEGLCIAVGAFDDNLKVRQYFFHGLVEHTLFGDGRVLDIFLVHSVKTRSEERRVGKECRSRRSPYD